MQFTYSFSQFLRVSPELFSSYFRQFYIMFYSKIIARADIDISI
jgi:hypothetical protein